MKKKKKKKPAKARKTARKSARASAHKKSARPGKKKAKKISKKKAPAKKKSAGAKHKKHAVKKSKSKTTRKKMGKTPPPGGYATGESIEHYHDGSGNNRAKAPGSVTAQGGTNFTFTSNGPDICFDPNAPSDPPGLFTGPVPSPAPVITILLPTVSHPTPFKYNATCGGAPVEGNSPPIIIVDN